MGLHLCNVWLLVHNIFWHWSWTHSSKVLHIYLCIETPAVAGDDCHVIPCPAMPFVRVQKPLHEELSHSYWKPRWRHHGGPAWCMPRPSCRQCGAWDGVGAQISRGACRNAQGRRVWELIFVKKTHHRSCLRRWPVLRLRDLPTLICLLPSTQSSQPTKPFPGYLLLFPSSRGDRDIA